jgi:hypothetical protein
MTDLADIGPWHYNECENESLEGRNLDIDEKHTVLIDRRGIHASCTFV